MEAEPLMPYRKVITDYITGKGKRPRNEDFVLLESWESGISIALIADGMGGYEDGDIAARTVSESIRDFLTTSLNQDDSISSQVKEAINKANKEILKLRTGHEKKLGATLAGILFVKDSAICFWLGDVKIIHFRDNHIHFQSKDHSLINELKLQNVNIDANNIKRFNHIVTRAILGNQENPEPDIRIIDNLSNSDRFIVCSDGVHNVVGPKDMELFIQQNKDPKSLSKMVSNKCELYGVDNYSLIDAIF